MSELRSLGDAGSYFDLVVEIRDGPSPSAAHLGYLRRFGRITSTAGGAVRRLVGDAAVVKVGAIDRGVWTDFFSVVDAPLAGGAGEDAREPRAVDPESWVATHAAVADTPWVAWVGFPREQIVAPAAIFMRRMLLLGLLFVLASMAFSGALGVRLTQPLHALARAAEEIAAGDYKRRVGAGRRDEIGRLSDAFNVMTDRIEEVHGALRNSHEQTQFALAAARIGVWESHLASGQMSCSESLGLMQGLSPGALPRTPDDFLALVHPEDRDPVRELLAGRGIGDEIFDVQWRGVPPDGTIRWIEGKGRRRLDEQGRPRSVLGVIVDVTERRRLESQLRQAQKMEAVGQLAGGVAHDFNNLLTSIVGHGELLLSELAERSPLREDLLEILKAEESAAVLTRQLLTFSRRQVFQPQVIAVNAIVARTERLLRRLIGEDVLFVTGLAATPDTVKMDPGNLEQVLVNLAVNARDAMPGGGTLTIGTVNEELEETSIRQDAAIPAGRYVVLSVSDTGTGMDAETQAHLFEPFFTTKPPGKGTGLGLATVFGIVNQSGGRIYVYSEPGHGATFKIYLPVSGEKPAPPPEVATPAPTTVGGTDSILVVDDNDAVRGIATAILERLGYRVLAAASGTEALSALAASGECPDLLVTDVIMPGLTGPDLWRELVARCPGVRVLFTSGYSGDALERHDVGTSGVMFLEKPYSPAALAKKVREALGDA